jgi:cytochrome c oxidase cbb3-type subunit 1
MKPLQRTILLFLFSCCVGSLLAQDGKPSAFTLENKPLGSWLIFAVALLLFVLVLRLRNEAAALRKTYRQSKNNKQWQRYLDELDGQQVNRLLEIKRSKSAPLQGKGLLWLVVAGTAALLPVGRAAAQDSGQPTGTALLSQSGIIITLVLILIPLIATVFLLILRISNTLRKQRQQQKRVEAQALAAYINDLPANDPQLSQLQARKAALDYTLSHNELAGLEPAADERGLLQMNQEPGLPIVALKKKALPRPNIDPQLSKLVLAYLVCAAGWLLFGTTVGEYLGIKFVAPDADHLSWLSFGRLRPVHTNAVFWGWASLGMLGLGYYIVPRVSNTALASIKHGWYTLWLINAAVILGSLCLMAGINNGGGEYREYIWPVMLLFGAGLLLTLINFMRTIARRSTKEIYISNWYIVSAIIFTIVISLAAYIPYWQNGLGETIIQGYYMHQGVGMWFMLFTLGIVYYFLPQQLNKPIYSYSLGILAFWSQIIFYTLIGTHHFVFSAIPWWLQTVAIVGSAGMIIPVFAGTTNFLLTFKGAWYKLKDSYTLPFFLVGIIFYFTGSLQGTAEAFRFTNLVWHFTDFTVAHSHITMYGIICFLLWACMYAVIPRLTGKEAPQITIGAHFWLALIGLLFYAIPLMYGGTMKGLAWMQGKPFMDGVVLMAPYWLWRAIGGTLMWVSHLFFAYNLYKMMTSSKELNVADLALQELSANANIAQPTPIVNHL